MIALHRLRYAQRYTHRRVPARAAASTRVVNYSSNILLLEYSLISISGCKFPFPVAIFLQSQDELLEFMQTWGFAISFATCQPGNGSEYRPIHGGGATQPAAGLLPSQCTAVRYHRCDVSFLGYRLYKNSSGDEIANVNFCTTTTYMERPAPTPIERVRNFY